MADGKVIHICHSGALGGGPCSLLEQGYSSGLDWRCKYHHLYANLSAKLQDTELAIDNWNRAHGEHANSLHFYHLINIRCFQMRLVLAKSTPGSQTSHILRKQNQTEHPPAILLCFVPVSC